MIAGLTGGIGSGKSTVAKIFELLGCPVFESDRVAKEVYFDPEVRRSVVQLLGEAAYLNDTEIDKTYISSQIFSNSKLLQALNAIIHPVVIERSKQFAQLHPGKLVIKETALLFEAEMEKDVDCVILVMANDETRIKRVMQRDGLSEEVIRKKIKSQIPEEEKMKRADFVIYNDETQLVIPQVLRVFDVLQKNFHV